jgi:hypothetical protein
MYLNSYALALFLFSYNAQNVQKEGPLLRSVYYTFTSPDLGS